MTSTYELADGRCGEADVESEHRSLSPLTGEVGRRRRELFSPDAAEVNREIMRGLLACPVCGCSMIGKRMDAKHCSALCRKRASRAKV